MNIAPKTNWANKKIFKPVLSDGNVDGKKEQVRQVAS
jgi:hypothetical protein